MPRGALTFKQRDVAAAVRAVIDAGCTVTSVEVDRSGRIVVHTGQPQAGASAPPLAAEPEANPWDEVLTTGAGA